MNLNPKLRRCLTGAFLIAISLVVLGTFGLAEAQRKQGAPQLLAPPAPVDQPLRKETEAQSVPPQPSPPARPAAPPAQPPRETVQADVSTRSVAVTSSFTGTEIIVFGAVDNSRQQTAESGFYDIVIIIEGTPT